MAYLPCLFLSLLIVRASTREFAMTERDAAEIIIHITQVLALTKMLCDLQSFLEILLRLGVIAKI